MYLVLRMGLWTSILYQGVHIIARPSTHVAIIFLAMFILM